MRTTLGLALTMMLLGCSANMTAGEAEVDTTSENTAATSSALPLATTSASFTVRVLTNKCIDVGGDAYQGVGAPVYVFGCNGTTAQTLRAVEVNDGSHDLRLVTSRGYCLGVQGSSVAAGRRLELQSCVTVPAIPGTQRFAYDGDTLFVGTQVTGRVSRDLVVEIFRGRSANRTPLVVGTREIDPAEDFRFVPVSTAAPYPTSGFVKVRTKPELDAALAQAHWGTVIEVASGASIVIDDDAWRFLKSGTTVRGNRRGMNDGPEIHRAHAAKGVLFAVDGDFVRVTGLRLRGPSASKSKDLPTVTGILSKTPGYRVLVDHNELSAWTDSAVQAAGTWDGAACYFGAPTPQNTRVIANYVHDNSRESAGYGVASMHGGNPYIDGNTFARNRHAIAADYRGQTSYTAKYNLVTESNDGYGTLGLKEHDFDVHGSEDGDHYQGGTAGYLFTMSSNTFFPSGKNIDIRGTPCNLVRIDHNHFFNNDASDAIENASTIPLRVQIFDNTFPPEIQTLARGDFDGDGYLDDFIGTGGAWYYRPGRVKDWRLLNRYEERHQQLTFGDFDGDGRTDVRIVDARGITQTSWGGSSTWDDGSAPPAPIPTTPPIVVAPR